MWENLFLRETLLGCAAKGNAHRVHAQISSSTYKLRRPTNKIKIKVLII